MANTPADTPGDAGAARDRPASRKRLYAQVGIGARCGGFVVLLDGRAAKTPGGTALVLPTLAAAEAVAQEWAQKEVGPATMPLTRIANAAIDAVAKKMDAVADELVTYAKTDLVCYRAEGPASLVKAEGEVWDPILAFAANRLGARFICTEGTVFVRQPAEAIAAVRAKIEEMTRRGPAAPLALASLAAMTRLTGSVLIALALAEGDVGLGQAWQAAHVDEDFEMRLWGADAEAMARRERRFAEMAAAERLWRLLAA